jgi:hypothetical protein
MDRQLNRLVQQLNRKGPVAWVPEMSLGEPAYAHLLGTLRRGALAANHTVNVMHALFRLRRHGSSEEVATELLRHAGRGDVKVRSAAVTLLVGLLKLGELAPDDHYVAAIREACEAGLLHDARELADDYMSRVTE